MPYSQTPIITIMESPTSFSRYLSDTIADFQKSGTMQRIIPREFSSQQDIASVTNNLHYARQSNHLNSLTKSISEPVWDLLDRGGKRWRPLLSILIAQIYNYGEGDKKVSKEQIYQLAALVEIVHNGTLMVDDIEDNSRTRRNKECVHLLFGVDIALNAGNFMYFAPISYVLNKSKFSQTAKLNIARIFMEEMTNLHIGQAWDILWHHPQKLSGQYPTENQYLQMTSHKTGVLARLSVRLVAVALDLSEEEAESLSRFAQKIGVAFQIQNDLLNLQGEDYVSVKGYAGQDINEGKLTLIVLHCISTSSKSGRLLQILKSHTSDTNIINQAIQILKSSGSLQYSRKVMHQLLEQAWTEVEHKLPQHPFKSYLRDLAYMNMTSKGT